MEKELCWSYMIIIRECFGAIAAVGWAMRWIALQPIFMNTALREDRPRLAMTLLQSGVDLLTIQAWLGHSQVATTHRYAAADVEMMRRGLDKAGVAGKQPARFQPKDAVLQLLEAI